MSWDSNDLKGFLSLSENKTGQIVTNDEMGLIINILSKHFNKYLEIGTWNGMGSTKCFIEGFKERKDKDYVFYSLECNSDKCDFAKKLYKDVPNVFLLNEVVTKNITHDDINKIFPNINEEYKKWHQIDMDNMINKAVFLERTDIPNFFDVILLDGGEFTTYFEYLLLKDMTKILILDDTEVFKCKQIAQELQSNNNWNIVIHNRTSRNGFLVAVRKDLEDYDYICNLLNSI